MNSAEDHTDPQATNDRLERVRRLLDALIAVPDVPPEAAGLLQLAGAHLMDPSCPPQPVPPQPPSMDVRADVCAALELLTLEIAGAAPATQSVRLAVVARYLQDAGDFLLPPVHRDAGMRPVPGMDQ